MLSIPTRKEPLKPLSGSFFQIGLSQSNYVQLRHHMIKRKKKKKDFKILKLIKPEANKLHFRFHWLHHFFQTQKQFNLDFQGTSTNLIFKILGDWIYWQQEFSGCSTNFTMLAPTIVQSRPSNHTVLPWEGNFKFSIRPKVIFIIGFIMCNKTFFVCLFLSLSYLLFVPLFESIN
ncbi:hypothetical protein CKAN_00578600 [Cinnamomum micranthum f. kanehirae]|uniref:Uncharacterized protein n=1 Tax=Cinnamomum micranthum f. kanehirae TaxID=337451 RepID=A0A3S3Q294_9MAGN|nr:hypothetical protein CKAN_00578600 [Cinnamomum micranthum f. kanehirae]